MSSRLSSIMHSWLSNVPDGWIWSFDKLIFLTNFAEYLMIVWLDQHERLQRTKMHAHGWVPTPNSMIRRGTLGTMIQRNRVLMSPNDILPHMYLSETLNVKYYIWDTIMSHLKFCCSYCTPPSHPIILVSSINHVRNPKQC